MIVGLHSCGGGRRYTDTLVNLYSVVHDDKVESVEQGREVRSMREAWCGSWFGHSAAVKPWACSFFSHSLFLSWEVQFHRTAVGSVRLHI